MHKNWRKTRSKFLALTAGYVELSWKWHVTQVLLSANLQRFSFFLAVITAVDVKEPKTLNSKKFGPASKATTTTAAAVIIANYSFSETNFTHISWFLKNGFIRGVLGIRGGKEDVIWNWAIPSNLKQSLNVPWKKRPMV